MNRLVVTSIFLLALTFCAVQHLPAQKQPTAVKVFQLVNEARTKPLDFLKNHKADLEHAPADFVARLKQNKPIDAAIWDPGLEANCRERVEKGSLNPEYAGKNGLCGSASGMHGASGGFDPMDILFDFHNNLFDPNCLYLGLHFEAAGSLYWYSWGYRCDAVKEPYSYTGAVDTSKVDFAKLNTAKGVKYLTENEQKMVAEINFARAYPKIYAQVVKRFLHEEAVDGGGLEHDEYVAGMELVRELEAMEPLSILKPMPCVYAAAKKHGLDCQKRGFLDHTGSDGSDPWDRILDECTELSYGNENLVGGHKTPRESLMALLIDSGISNRGHRYNALNKDWKYVGCYYYSMGVQGFPDYGNWVQNFAE